MRDLAFDFDTYRDVHKGGIMATGIDAIRQRIILKLSIWRGEWFLDTDVGMPYVQELIGKRGTHELLRRVVKGKIENTDGVVEVTKISLSIDAKSRHVKIECDILTTYGRLQIDI